MYPILLSWGPLKIYSFGVFLFLAFLTGSFLVWREGRKQRLDEERLLDLILTVAFFGLLGGRIFHLATNFEQFGFAPLKWLLFFHFPGLSFLGAVVGGIVGSLFFAKKTGWSFWQVTDLLVLGVAFGEGIGRIGAFLSGSAYGSVTNLPWAVTMIGLVEKRHPVQIYESLTAFLIFLLLLKLKQTVETKKFSTGLLFSAYLFLLGTTKFFLDFARGERVYLFGWRVMPVVGFFLTLSGFLLFYRRLGRSPRTDLVLAIDKLNKVFLRLSSLKIAFLRKK